MNVFLKSVLHREAEIKYWNIKLLPFSPTAWQPATWSSSNSWGSQRREDSMRIIGYNILFSYGAYAISSVIQKPSCTLAEMFTYYASIRAVQRNCKRTCKITTYFPPSYPWIWRTDDESDPNEWQHLWSLLISRIHQATGGREQNVKITVFQRLWPTAHVIHAEPGLHTERVTNWTKCFSGHRGYMTFSPAHTATRN